MLDIFKLKVKRGTGAELIGESKGKHEERVLFGVDANCASSTMLTKSIHTWKVAWFDGCAHRSWFEWAASTFCDLPRPLSPISRPYFTFATSSALQQKDYKCQDFHITRRASDARNIISPFISPCIKFGDEKREPCAWHLGLFASVLTCQEPRAKLLSCVLIDPEPVRETRQKYNFDQTAHREWASVIYRDLYSFIYPRFVINAPMSAWLTWTLAVVKKYQPAHRTQSSWKCTHVSNPLLGWNSEINKYYMKIPVSYLKQHFEFIYVKSMIDD